MNLPYVQDLTILSMDELRTHQRRQLRYHGPEASRAQCAKKLNLYLKPVWCKIITMTEGVTAVMLVILTSPKLRAVANLRNWNNHTRIFISHAPVTGIVRRSVTGQVHTMFYAKSSTFQWINPPKHVSHSTVTKLDGDTEVVNHVIRRHLFRPILPYYISRFMDIHLEDIVIDLDKLNSHTEQIKTVLNMLQWEGLYLSKTKPHFVQLALRFLGGIIRDQGMQMDPDKVDHVLRVPANLKQDLPRDFIGLVRYLLDGVPKWCNTRQPALEEMNLDHRVKKHLSHRVPPSYPMSMAPTWAITDGVTRIPCVAYHGDWKMLTIFKLAVTLDKWINAQQTIAIHGISTPTSVDAVLSYTHILLGTQVSWLINHKKMIHLPIQRNRTDLLAQWLGKTISVNFCVSYIERNRNGMADMESEMDPKYLPGMEQARRAKVVMNDETNVAVLSDGVNVDMLEASDLALNIRMADIVAQGARSESLTGRTMWDQSNSMVYICFVLECPAGQKEGGSTSQTDNNDHMDKTNNSESDGEKLEVVTVTVIITHHRSVTVIPNSDTEVLTTLTSQSQCDNSIERDNFTTTITKACVHPLPVANQTDWMCRIILLLICTSGYSSLTETEYQSSHKFAL